MDYEILKEKYIEGETLSDAEYDYLLACIEEFVKMGEPVDEIDREIILESGYDVDADIIDTGRHGWVQWFSVYKMGDRYFRMDYSSHDDVGIEFDEKEAILPEVEPREVTVTKWFVKGVE